jgi:hypothetical protein
VGRILPVRECPRMSVTNFAREPQLDRGVAAHGGPTQDRSSGCRTIRCTWESRFTRVPGRGSWATTMPSTGAGWRVTRTISSYARLQGGQGTSHLRAYRAAQVRAPLDARVLGRAIRLLSPGPTRPLRPVMAWRTRTPVRSEWKAHPQALFPSWRTPRGVTVLALHLYLTSSLARQRD